MLCDSYRKVAKPSLMIYTVLLFIRLLNNQLLVAHTDEKEALNSTSLDRKSPPLHFCRELPFLFKSKLGALWHHLSAAYNPILILTLAALLQFTSPCSRCCRQRESNTVCKCGRFSNRSAEPMKPLVWLKQESRQQDMCHFFPSLTLSAKLFVRMKSCSHVWFHCFVLSGVAGILSEMQQRLSLWRIQVTKVILFFCDVESINNNYLCMKGWHVLGKSTPLLHRDLRTFWWPSSFEA